MIRLVGRAPELRQLLAAVSRVEGGRSEAMVIEGEAGIGKTRLLCELQTHCVALGWTVIVCQAEQNSPEIPGGVLEVAIRSAVDGLTDLGRLKPTLVIIDNAHLLDAASQRTLSQLSCRTDRPALTVAAFRPASDEAIVRTRAELELSQTPTISLSPLSADASRELGAAVFGELTTEAHSRLDLARGNPFLICELMRAALLSSENNLIAATTVDVRSASTTTRHNLPLSVTPLIGREIELDQLHAILATERLLTIAGAGGCGKTRLAIHFGQQLLDQHAGRLVWVELAHLTDASGCVSALASALGVPQVSSKSLVAGIIDALRIAEVAIIVIDNAEHLLDATAALVNSILSTVDGVKIVCTSREPLGAHGEVVWRLPSLSVPSVGVSTLANAVDSIAHRMKAATIGQYEAVRLFVDRSARVQRGFVLNDENAPAIATICSRLDGLPLAIELAAARMSLMAPERIAEQLNDRFRLLAGGRRAAVPRQQTLQASVEWSEELLDPLDRVVFRRLGVFVGGFTIEAATGVVSSDPDSFKVAALDVPEVLGRLVNKSLLVFDDRTDRYSMLETIRTFALQRLAENGEVERLRDVHAEWFAQWLEGLNRFIYSGTMQDFVERSGVMSRRIDLDRPNCYAALEWTVPGSPLSLRLCGGLGYYWLLAQNGTDAIGFSESVLLNGDQQSSIWLDAAMALSGVLGNAHNTVIAGLASVVSQRAYDSGDVRAILNSEYHSGWNLALNGPTAPQLAIAGSQRQRANELGDWFVVLNTTVMVAMGLAVAGRLPESLGLLGQFEHHRTLLTESTCRRQNGDFTGAAALLAPVDAYLADLPSASGEILLQTMAAAELALLTQDESHLFHRRFIGGSGFVYAGTVEFSRTMAIGLIHIIDGDLAAARVAFASRTETFSGGRSARWLCQVEAAIGDRKAARETAVKLIERWKDEITPAFDAPAYLVVGECDAATEVVSALDNMHRSLSVASEFALWPAVVDALEGIGSVLVAGGRVRDGARLLGASNAARARMGYRYRFAHRKEYVAAARDSAATDSGWAEGMGIDLAEAVTFAQRMRGTRIKVTSGWESLTPTELQVVELVAAGLANPKIAERLFMSRATVKTHLVHVFAKLGVSNRAELAAQATRRDGR